MNVDYVLFDPTGNITILVPTQVPPAQQPAVAAALMAREPTAEQVGFLSRDEGYADLALRMAGGEFCGNAAMCAAVWWSRVRKRESGAALLHVIGPEVSIRVDVCRLPGPRDWLGEVTMPQPAPPRMVTLPLPDRELALPLVDMGGIQHLVLEEAMEPALAEQAVRQWCRLLGAPALGLMQPELKAGSLIPLVYVPGADTLYWERSCASGTAAVAYYLACRQQESVRYRFAEPGGILEVHATPSGRIHLRGQVKVCREDSLELDVAAL